MPAMKHAPNPRSMLSALLGTAVFAVAHFVPGCVLLAAWEILRWRETPRLGETLILILINIWWFPIWQINPFLTPSPIVNYGLPISNSVLWGAIGFAVWKAKHAHHFKFGLRELLVATTVLALLLGVIAYLIELAP